MSHDHRPLEKIERSIRFACYLALAALGLIAWSLVHPKPLPVVGAMSVGQALGTLSLGLFVYAILADLRRTFQRARGIAAPHHKIEAPKGERDKGAE